MENYFRLDTKDLKKDLKKARDKKPVEGFLNFVDNGRSSALDYKVEYEDGKAYLEVCFGPEPQRILLSERKLSFGVMSYLVCGCGRHVHALYLKFGYFACFRCQRLRYRSTSLNATSEHGRFLQLQGNRLRLIEKREKITRPIYDGNYTKSFLHWLDLCVKVGMTDEVVRAQNTMDAIKGK